MIKKLLSSGFKEYKNHRKVIYQTSFLFISQIFIIIISLGSKTLQSRGLGPINYGLYAFFITITAFTVFFFRFGLFVSIQNLLATNYSEQREKELFGIGFLIALTIGLIYALFIFFISFFIDIIFKIELGHILRSVSLFCFILPFQFLIPALSIGSNKIRNIVLYNIFSKLFFIIPILILFFYNKLTVISVILSQLSALIITVLYLLKNFKPSFHNLKITYMEVINKNKEFGFHYYSGATINQTTYKLDGILITYFVNPIQLGFYNLASAICSPMVMLSESLSTSLFKKFANVREVPKKVFLFNIIWLSLCVLFLLISSKIIVILLFGKEYLIVAKYIFPLSFAYFFQGLYQPLAFLAAKSKGREIRNVAIMEAIINVIGNLTLIPLIGVAGAIYSSIAARFVHFLGLWQYYRKYLQELH